MSLYALRQLRLDAVWWLVSPQNPLKSRAEMAPLDRRLAMAARVARHPRLVVTAIETALGTRHTARTLSALVARFPRTRFVWLMGADNLTQIEHWQDWTKIFGTVPVAVFRRPPYCLKAMAGKAARRFARHRVAGARAGALADMAPPAWCLLRNPLHPASATAIRRRNRPVPDTPL
jgi:nicotinate-nucleotide adenylyltransferase